MSIHSPRTLTAAEQALSEAFDASSLEGAARSTAIEMLRRDGLPTRRNEAFHYTDLRALLTGSYRVADEPSDEASRAIGDAFPRLVRDAAVLHFRDGYFHDRGEALPEGVSVDAALPQMETGAQAGDAIGMLNTAFAIGGASIRVADGANVARTVGMAHAATGQAGTLGAIRNTIEVGKGARCKFVERSIGPDGVDYLMSALVRLDIAEGATVDYTLSIEEGDAASHLARLDVTLGTDATLNLFVLNAGGLLVRQELVFDVTGEGAALNIRGVNLIGGKSHIDVTSRITHHVPNTTATETFRNVATDRGHGIFQGQINVRQPAQLTDARMACNTLLLSDDCAFSAKPELEIFADDVQCAHGATVTDLEDSYMFYLMARGISEISARRMLIRAFVAEVVEEIEDEPLVESLEARIDAWMERHV